MTAMPPQNRGARRPSPLAPLLSARYLDVQRAHPADGRRKRLLRVVDHFWQLSSGEQATLDAQAETSNEAVSTYVDQDEDPLDAITNEPTLGIVVRTDFSDDQAWAAFLQRLHDEEAELTQSPAATAPAMTADESNDEDAMDEDDSDEESDDIEEEARMFSILDPQDPSERQKLTGLSNLGALRLLCDVDVRRAPERPQDTPRAPAHRLVDLNGWQEVYSGKHLWIYDARSNSDQSVRVVSSCGDMYGTATGDSWRARVGFIPELQLNVASGAMRIDFGGLDRWDHIERQRNLQEANESLVG